MATFKILIIDDRPLREADLRNIFNNEEFYIDFISEKDVFWHSISSLPQYDCIICDISLDNWVGNDTTKNMFQKVMEAIGTEIPIVLYSSVMAEVISWTKILLDDKYNLIYTFALNEVNKQRDKVESKENIEILHNNLIFSLYKEKNYKKLNIKPNDDINILHISDLQFQDPKFNTDLADSFEGELRKNIRDEKIPNIDFIAITGDIAFDAAPDQYKEAKKWIENLCKSIFKYENFQDRLLLVPGNHDANLSLCSMNIFNYHFPNKKKGDTEGRKFIKFDKRENEIADYTMFSVDPFRDFAFSLTKDENWLNKESMSFINSKFCYLGICFFHLNVLNPNEQLGFVDAKFKLDTSVINKLKDEYQRLNLSNNVYSIILAHPSPTFLGYDFNDEHKYNWTTIARFFDEINGNLYMCGHRHKNLLKKPIPLSSEKNLELCGTATLLCEPDSGDNRGFKIITIKRQNNVVTDIPIIYSFRFINDGTIKKDD